MNKGTLVPCLCKSLFLEPTIKAKITGIEYKIKLTKKLDCFSFNNFDINLLPSSCLVEDREFLVGLSKWVSPKRTRSYPYERIYNILGSSKRITVIPIIKDEGKNGDRDYIQWDTISLMSLLDVFVIFTYYKSAKKHPTKEHKITKQEYDNKMVEDKMKEIKNYHSSALHWNLKEIECFLPDLIQKVKESYSRIGEEFGVIFHSDAGIDKFAKNFANGVSEFMNTSRSKAQEAQNREMQTIQPKEALSTLTKAKITIENYLGGLYYFTTDEIEIDKVNKSIYLIEAKHSKSSSLPSIGDIKDGLLKMILYTNLQDVYVEEKKYHPIPVIKLTSSRISGAITSDNNKEIVNEFISINGFSSQQILIISTLFEEAKQNNFLVIICGAK